VQMVGDDGANAPAAHALANRGIVENVRGYTLYGDYREQSPPARILDAVRSNEIDVAVVWGPLAGYFAGKDRGAFEITPVSPQIDRQNLPFVYDISIGIRRGEDDLKARIEDVLSRKRQEIDRILDAYHVPRAASAVPLQAKEGG
jgi:mxaJ protein